MRKTLEDLYYGNITPHAQDMTAGSELKQAVGRVARYENQLTEQLDETGQTILTKLVRSQHEIDSITAIAAFKHNTSECSVRVCGHLCGQ